MTALLTAILVLLAAICQTAAISGDIIYTFAGTGASGYDGDGNAATAAFLSLPSGIALDSDSNVYFADSKNNVVRKITISTGVISTVAGYGVTACQYGCFSGDGGAATSAYLRLPLGVAIYGDNLYIADKFNNRIRKVVLSTGMISTVAGSSTSTDFGGDNGAATSATFNYPQGVMVDTYGSLYISDTSNNRVRKVDYQTNIITTIAGTGSTQPDVGGDLYDGSSATRAIINQPIFSVVDGSNNIFIADSGNNRIRNVLATTGIIYTCAGGGGTVADSTGDGGLATSALLNSPTGVAIDIDENIYFVDAKNYRIRKVTKTTGIITTIAGTGASSSSTGDGGLATSATLYGPFGIAVSTGNIIYFTELYGNKVRAIKLVTETPTNSPSYSPSDIPTRRPTRIPTPIPTAMPTRMPTPIPTAMPTPIPTAMPTLNPTPITGSPSSKPTTAPSCEPTVGPSAYPTFSPTGSPTAVPTVMPTAPSTMPSSPHPTTPPTNNGALSVNTLDGSVTSAEVKAKINYYLGSYLAYFLLLFIILTLLDWSKIGKDRVKQLHTSAYSASLFTPKRTLESSLEVSRMSASAAGSVFDKSRKNVFNKLLEKDYLILKILQDEVIRYFTHSLTHPLTYSLTHSLTQLLTHSLTHF